MLDAYFPTAAGQPGQSNPPDVSEISIVPRTIVPYTPTYQRFMKKDVRFTTQFSHVYLNRFIALTPFVKESLKLRYENEKVKVVEKIIDLAVGESGVVIGTIYKEQMQKPSVLDKFAHEFDDVAVEEKLDTAKNYCSDSDKLILEDVSGRMTLCNLGSEVIDSVVTGIVVAVKGILNEDGEFSVDKDGICFPNPPPQRALKLDSMASTGDLPNSKFVALVSGLGIGGKSADPLKLQLLSDYLTGHIAGSHQQLQRSIVRLLSVGNNLAEQFLPTDDASDPVLQDDQNRLVGPIRQLDLFLAEIATSIPVDVMPGNSDSMCTKTWPQQPIKRILLPQSSRCRNTFRSVTNPYEFTIGEAEVSFLGHSGQAISDLRQYTKGKSTIELLKSTIDWRHLCPTAPDTLPCFPLTEYDPFTLDKELPHVYFCGNQEKFETVRYQPLGSAESAVRIISVPDFDKTGTIVLVDINSPTLETFTFSFDS